MGLNPEVLHRILKPEPIENNASTSSSTSNGGLRRDNLRGPRTSSFTLDVALKEQEKERLAEAERERLKVDGEHVENLAEEVEELEFDFDEDLPQFHTHTYLHPSGNYSDVFHEDEDGHDGGDEHEHEHEHHPHSYTGKFRVRLPSSGHHDHSEDGAGAETPGIQSEEPEDYHHAAGAGGGRWGEHMKAKVKGEYILSGTSGYYICSSTSTVI